MQFKNVKLFFKLLNWNGFKTILKATVGIIPDFDAVILAHITAP